MIDSFFEDELDLIVEDILVMIMLCEIVYEVECIVWFMDVGGFIIVLLEVIV